MKWTLALVASAGLAGLLAGFFLHPEPDRPPAEVRTVWRDRPEPEPTIKERIVYHEVPVASPPIVRERVDTLKVREFVEAATDSTAVPIYLPGSIEYDGDRLSLWLTKSNGDLTLSEFDLKPTFRAGWDADSTWAREERLARFPTVKVAVGTTVVAGVIACLLLCR